MAPTTRQARRSHANDASQSDELANPEASVLRTPSKGTSRPQDSSTFPKRRGRPPGSKNRPKTITTLSPTKQPRSTRRGRPPGSAMGNLEPPDMPDKQIALALNRGDENPNTNHRVAQASRRVFRYTAQWPWQWAVRFLPRKKWTVPLVEDLAQLLGAIYQKSVNTSTDNGNLEIARRFLYKRAQHRSRFCPQITGGDVIEALRYFEVETRRTLPDVQQTSQSIQPGRVIGLVGSDTESQPDEIPTEYGVINEDLTATEDESEVSYNDEHSNEHESVISNGNSASSRERMLSPTRISHVEQRSQVNNSQTGQIGQSADRFSSDTTPTTVCPTSASATTIFANLVDAIAPVLVELEARKESLTCDLSILRQSIRDKEDAIKRTVTATVQTEVIDSMRGALRKHEEEREQMQIAKGNFEQSLSTFKMTQDMISYIYQGYNTQIQEWDEIILRTKTEIQHAVEEALRSNKAEIDDLKAALQEDKCQAWRLEGDVKETNDHLKSCRLGTSLGQLGSPGISTLMANLERHGVFLFHMIAEVRTADQPR